MKLTILGATETVTGSKYLVEGANLKLLIDCGSLQGAKNLESHNWSALPAPLDTLDGVILTHAHVDHPGYLPMLVRMGYHGPIYCTESTRAQCKIMLRNSAKQQEEEACFASWYGFSEHQAGLPMYTLKDAEDALHLLVPVDFHTTVMLNEHASFRLLPAGHILGAASLILHADGKTIAFSGDIRRARPHDAPNDMPPDTALASRLSCG